MLDRLREYRADVIKGLPRNRCCNLSTAAEAPQALPSAPCLRHQVRAQALPAAIVGRNNHRRESYLSHKKILHESIRSHEPARYVAGRYSPRPAQPSKVLSLAVTA